MSPSTSADRARSVLKPDVDLRRTVGWFTTFYPVALNCTNGEGASARQLLDDVHDTLNAVPHYGIGYGLLRYLYAPTARLLGAARPADIFFSYVGTIPDLPSVSSDEPPCNSTPTPRCRCARRFRASGTLWSCGYIAATGVLHLDWWYDRAGSSRPWRNRSPAGSPAR